MSAAVIPFKGKWHGHSEPTPYPAEARAMHDARAIAAAKAENDGWTARLLLALLDTLDAKQRELVEFRLLGANLSDPSGVQALAIVQLANGSKKHRDCVTAALSERGGF